MAINFAGVLFYKKNVTAIREIGHISTTNKGHEPIKVKDHQDFNKQTKLYSTWYGCGDDGEPCSNKRHPHSLKYKPVRIFCLAG